MQRLLLTVAAAAIVGHAGAALARDQIRVVGSSTVFPFTTAVAEQFGSKSGMKTPVVESTGTGGGIKLFCSGVGAEFPDFANASRQINKGEVEACAKAGVREITEIKVGFDGIVLANSKAGPDLDVTIPQLWQALAKQVPQGGKLVANPYKSWNQIDPSLPDEPIEVLGPPPTSGTRDAFVELVMDHGCAEFPEVKALDEAAKKAACQTVREDGAYVDAGENDNLIVQKLAANPAAFGIFGYGFLDQNVDKLKGARSPAWRRPTRTSPRASTRSRARSSSTRRTRTWA
jgi:phosphate transport system substrate-binding protein